MKSRNFFPMIGVAALLAAGVNTTLADSEAQARALEALRQKMAEMDAQGSTKPGTPAPVVPARPTPPPAPVVVTPPPAPVVVPPRPTPPPAPVVTAPVVAAPVVATPTPPPQVDADAQARAVEALRQKMSQLDAQSPTAPVAPTAVQHYRPAVPKNAVAPAVNTPAAAAVLQPPPSALPAGKEAKLADLLAKYRADAITPEQYHTQRAAIIAGP